MERHLLESLLAGNGSELLPGFGTEGSGSVKLAFVRGVHGGWLLFSVVIAGGILLMIGFNTQSHRPQTIQAKPTKSAARAAGFDVKGEAFIISNPETETRFLKTVMSAGGPMHSNEILRFEGQTFLADASGKETALGESQWTFAERLVSQVPFPAGLEKGVKVILRGRVYVYRREEIKVERDVQPDKSVKLYMNTGWVWFKNVQTPMGKRVQLTCTNLKSVHEHGLELVSKDKKSVSGRILLTPGDQVIDRESIPYQGVNVGLEPINVRQLLPKRSEPVALAIPIQGL